MGWLYQAIEYPQAIQQTKEKRKKNGLVIYGKEKNTRNENGKWKETVTQTKNRK